MRLVHHLGELLEALDADDTPLVPVDVLGVLAVRSLEDTGREVRPKAIFSLIADCRNDAALACEAMRAGLQVIGFRGAAAMAAKLEEIAARQGARIVRLPNAFD